MNAKKDYKIFQKERFQTLCTKIYSYLFKFLDFNRKNICVVMQSSNVVEIA